MSNKSLYERLGGYDAIVAVSGNLLPRLMSDSRLKRFWDHRGQDGIDREKQLLIDFLCANSGGPIYYTGRDMKVSHKGMKISEADWTAFMGHVNATLDVFKLPPTERGEVVGFVQSLKKILSKHRRGMGPDDLLCSQNALGVVCLVGRSFWSVWLF